MHSIFMPKRNKINRKTQQNRNPEPVITDFGIRKVSQQNFSKIVALPKMALENCGITSQVSVKLVQFHGVKLIQLTPIESKEVKISE